MRKVILWNMMTLDGFFEGPKSWDIDWHEYVWGEELEQLSVQNQSRPFETQACGGKTPEDRDRAASLRACVSGGG
jgi:hypothetical protein